MRNFDNLAVLGAASAFLLSGAGQAQGQPVAFANCNPIARQLFIDQQLTPDTPFKSWVLEPPSPETTSIIAREADNPGNYIVNPGVIKCGKQIVDYFGLQVELIGDKTYISTTLLTAANTEVSQSVGLQSTPVKNPESAGLLVQRTLRFQFDDVYGPLGFSDGNLTFGLMP